VIASVANIFLWIKENSPQYGNFFPYRLTGVGPTPGVLLKEHEVMPFPYVAIGRSKAALVIYGIHLFESNPDIKIKFNGFKIAYLCDQILDLFKLYSGERPTSAAFKKFETYKDFVEVSRY
jgi:hypothetical protein